jgi:uncharacterized protein YcbX
VSHSTSTLNIKAALGVVSKLYTYPVKSLAGILQQQLTVGELGPEGDRRWLVCRPDGQFVTQRENALMSRVLASEQEDGIALLVPDKSPICVAYPPGDALKRSVVCWGDNCEAQDAGEEAAQYLSQYLGEPVQLVYMPRSGARRVDERYLAQEPQEPLSAAETKQGDMLSFADGFPFLLVNDASVKAFETRLGRHFCAMRFRPNIVICGAEPFAEDSWQRIKIGAIEFDLVKPCTRCVIPSIDPNTANRETDVSKCLNSFRRDLGGDRPMVYFGQNMVARGSGIIQVSDPVIQLK